MTEGVSRWLGCRPGGKAGVMQVGCSRGKAEPGLGGKGWRPSAGAPSGSARLVVSGWLLGEGLKGSCPQWVPRRGAGSSEGQGVMIWVCLHAVALTRSSPIKVEDGALEVNPLGDGPWTRTGGSRMEAGMETGAVGRAVGEGAVGRAVGRENSFLLCLRATRRAFWLLAREEWSADRSEP